MLPQLGAWGVFCVPVSFQTGVMDHKKHHIIINVNDYEQLLDVDLVVFKNFS
jgi:hypothetical protein